MAVKVGLGEVGCGLVGLGMVIFLSLKIYNMKKYSWKLKNYGRGIDAKKIVKEFERIDSVYGSLTPDIILGEAEKKDCILHSLFEWDDSEAARQYRLQQARNIINNISVEVISNGKPRDVGAYEVVTGEAGRSYKSVHELTVQDIEEVRSNTIRDLNYLNEKISFYSEFSKAKPHLCNAIKSLSK